MADQKSINVSATVKELEKKVKEVNQLMFYVLIVLLLMVAGMLITTGFWLIDSFNSKDRPQTIYNYTVENDPIKETAKDIEIRKLKEKIDIYENQKIIPLPESERVKLDQ